MPLTCPRGILLGRQLESLPAHAPYIHDGKKFAPVRK